MTRVVSYDHHPPRYQPPASIPVRPELLKRYAGRYHTEASGDIDVTLENDALVLRSGGLRITLGASAPGRFFALERDLRINFQLRAGQTTIEIEENGTVVARGSRKPDR